MPGSPRRWDLAAIVQWLRTQGPWRPRVRAEVKEEEVGPPTASLERLRLVRCKREELALRRELGEVMLREDVHEYLGRIGALIRRATETLQRRIGPETSDVMSECFDDFEREMRAWCESKRGFHEQWKHDTPSDLLPSDAGVASGVRRGSPLPGLSGPQASGGAGGQGDGQGDG